MWIVEFHYRDGSSRAMVVDALQKGDPPPVRPLEPADVLATAIRYEENRATPNGSHKVVDSYSLRQADYVYKY